MAEIQEQLGSSWMSQNEDFEFPSLGGNAEDAEERILRLRLRWNAAVDVVSSQSSCYHNDDHDTPHDNVGEIKRKSINSDQYSECVNLWFDKILDMHTEKERSYHTLCHIEEMFGFVDLIMDHETASFQTDVGADSSSAKKMLRAVVHLSIFFHDCVYNAKSSANEEQSAKLFMQFVEELLKCCSLQPCTGRTDENDLDVSLTTSRSRSRSRTPPITWRGSEIVHEFIMATKSHSIKSEGEGESEQIRYLKIFLDSDMAVLGKQPKAYEHYASLIRKEYEHVEHDVYCEKRAEILESFIGSVTDSNSKKHIYLTASMRDALEEMAVANLKREIDSLRNGIIPGVE